MENFEILKEAFIKVLKNPRDVDICNYCKHQVKCEGKNCPKYCSGVGDVDGKYPNFKWTCEDFHFGTCEMLENTPCNGCIENHDCGFELDLTKLSPTNTHKHNMSFEEDDFLPKNDKYVNVDVFVRCKCNLSIDELTKELYDRYRFIVLNGTSYGVSKTSEAIVYSVKIDRNSWKNQK